MKSAPFPKDESARLAALRATRLLDSPPEEQFDEIVELASLLCGTPMALISLVDGDRQWFKARVGLDADETPREVAFCAHAILDPDSTFEVPDATQDERFFDNPLVTGAPDLRAYYGRPLRGPEGDILGTLCVLDQQPRKLTGVQLRGLEILARQVEAQIELRCARDEALSLLSIKSQFLATMSHEIRTPLHGMLGTLDLVLDDEIEEALRDDLGAARSAGRQLHSLLCSVLDISKAGVDELELELQPTNLRNVVESVTATFAGNARRNGVKLGHRVAPEVPECNLADATRMTQILGNLVGNAVKFTSEGSIDVRIVPGDERAYRFEVCDTGDGIAEHDLLRIFERFQQTTHSKGGTGIGLSLAKDLVELMGGTLNADSAVGLGSRFWFEIDLEPAEMESPDTDPEDIVLPAAHVLLVDDEKLNLRIGSRILEKMGLSVTSVADGQTAIQELRTGSYDVALLDCYMGTLSGFEVAMTISEEPNGPPMIGLTASVISEVRDQCIEAGMVDVLEKPIDRPSLKKALASALGVRAAA